MTIRMSIFDTRDARRGCYRIRDANRKRPAWRGSISDPCGLRGRLFFEPGRGRRRSRRFGCKQQRQRGRAARERGLGRQRRVRRRKRPGRRTVERHRPSAPSRQREWRRTVRRHHRYGRRGWHWRQLSPQAAHGRLFAEAIEARSRSGPHSSNFSLVSYVNVCFRHGRRQRQRVVPRCHAAHVRDDRPCTLAGC